MFLDNQSSNPFWVERNQGLHDFMTYRSKDSSLLWRFLFHTDSKFSCKKNQYKLVTIHNFNATDWLVAIMDSAGDSGDKSEEHQRQI